MRRFSLGKSLQEVITYCREAENPRGGQRDWRYNSLVALSSWWHDPFKLDRLGCEYFLAVDEEATHEAQGKQPASPLKTIDAFTMEEDPIVVWALKHPMSLRKT